MNVIVVGAGLTGASATRALLDAGHDVTVYEFADTVGGLCADIAGERGYAQLFGPHHLHTERRDVIDFLSRFAEFRPQLLTVGVEVRGWVIPLPINERSADILGYRLTDAEIKAEVFENYSAKHWGREWNALPDLVKARVPGRNAGYDPRYSRAMYQYVPVVTWESVVKKMIDGARLVRAVWDLEDWDCKTPVVYTGHLDHLMDGQRSLHWLGARFNHYVDYSYSFGEYAAINVPDAGQSIIRRWDNSRFIGCRSASIVSTQTPRADGVALYPCFERERYADVAARVPAGIYPAGRCGRYEYMDMDQAILDGLSVANRIMEE